MRSWMLPALLTACLVITAAAVAAPASRLAFVSSEGGGMRISIATTSGALAAVTAREVIAHSPGWSPDGRRLVYAAATLDGLWHIHVMNTDGSRSLRLTSGDGDHVFPAWSPDGRHVLYVRRHGADEQIYVMDPDGRLTRRLTAPPGRSTVPVWSPDGRWIAFVSTRGGGVPQLFVMREDGTEQRQLSRADAYVGNAYGRGAKTVEPIGVLLRPGMLHPGWSPDGTRIAFVTRVGRAEQQILIVDRTGGEPRRLSTGYAPAWSPDGTRIAFVVARVGDSQIYVMKSDGTALRRLTSGGANMLPVWSRDGRWLAFLGADERGLGLYVMRADGTDRRRLGEAAGDLSMGPVIAWQP